MKKASIRSGILALFVFILFASWGGAPKALADGPSVSSFTESAASVPSGSPISFAWSESNANGYHFIISCITGVSYSNTANGQGIPCNSAQSWSNASSDGVSIITVNASGSNQNIVVEVIPLDQSGNEVATAGATLIYTSTPITTPVTSFTVATSTSLGASAITGDTFTFNWQTAPSVPGVNIILQCVGAIRFYTPALTPPYAPCGSFVAPSALPSSGSFTVTTSGNTNAVGIPVLATIYPEVSGNTYDLNHPQVITITVPSSIMNAALAASSFVASSTAVYSGVLPDTISWNAQTATGINLQIPCVNNISIAAGSATSTPLPCNKPAFASLLPARGNVALFITNIGGFAQDVPITLLIGQSDGSLAAFGTQIHITAFAAGATPTNTSSSPSLVTLTNQTVTLTQNTSASTATPSSNTTTSSKLSVAASAVLHSGLTFKSTLTKGSSGKEVSLLQTVLAQDPSIYPSGGVTGYYGNLTVAAVEKFQMKYGIASAGNAMYGGVGVKTRAKLNALLSTY
jgi:Putative peptidoglycan binding domain